MYCPNCGTQAPPDQRYCRSCGFSLQLISQVVTGRPPDAQREKILVEAAERFQSQRFKMRRWGFITLWGGMVVAAFLGIVGGAITGIAPMLGAVIASLAGLGGLILIIGVGIMIYSLFLPRALDDRQPSRSAALPQAAATVPLPPQRRPESAPSVTEHTTELLETSDPETPGRNATRQRE
jgi:hypothetical protein